MKLFKSKSRKSETAETLLTPKKLNSLKCILNIHDLGPYEEVATEEKFGAMDYDMLHAERSCSICGIIFNYKKEDKIEAKWKKVN